MSTTLQVSTSPTLPLLLPRVTAILRAALKRMIAARQAKADRIVEEHLARLGLPHPRHQNAQPIAQHPANGGLI